MIDGYSRIGKWWNRWLAWSPLQLCIVCGRPYWGGWPTPMWRWFWFLPAMVELCSARCYLRHGDLMGVPRLTTHEE